MKTESLRIAGEKVGADRQGDRAIEVFNPYTASVIGSVPKATREEVRRAIAIAPRLPAEAHALRARQHPQQGGRPGARAHAEIAR